MDRHNIEGAIAAALPEAIPAIALLELAINGYVAATTQEERDQHQAAIHHHLDVNRTAIEHLLRDDLPSPDTLIDHLDNSITIRQMHQIRAQDVTRGRIRDLILSDESSAEETEPEEPLTQVSSVTWRNGKPVHNFGARYPIRRPVQSCLPPVTKHFDTNFAITVNNGSIWTPVTIGMTQVTQGTTVVNFTGRGFIIKKIEFSFFGNVVYTQALSATIQSPGTIPVRMAAVLDKKNHLSKTVADIWGNYSGTTAGTEGMSSVLNADNLDRFEILWERFWNVATHEDLCTGNFFTKQSIDCNIPVLD